MSRWASIFLLGVAACASPSLRTVPRVVDGKVETGPFVSPYAYEWFIEGEASASMGRHDEAAIAFENATAAPANDELLLTRLAEEYELSGASRRADRTLAVARRSYPRSPLVALAQGRLAQHRGEYDEALARYARATELAPSWDEPVLATAQALNATRQTERAVAVLFDHVATKGGGGSDRARSMLLGLLERTGDAETLLRALSLDSSAARATGTHAAAELALRTGQPALAARLLAKSIDGPDDVALWLRAALASGDREKVAGLLEGAEGARLAGRFERVDLLLRLGKHDSALGLLGDAEGSPTIDYAKGRALSARGDYADAAAFLAEVPLGVARFEEARIALAECSAALGRPGAAAEALSQAPHGSLVVRQALAEIYVEQGAPRNGLRLLDPKRARERAALASLFERAGRFEEAAAYYAAVKTDSSDDPGLRARASAEQLASRGNLRAAIAVLERRADTAPDDLYSRVRLVELLVADYQSEAAEKRGRPTLEVIDEPILRSHLVDILVGAVVPAR